MPQCSWPLINCLSSILWFTKNIPLNTWIVEHFFSNLFDSSFEGEYRLLCKLSSFHYRRLQRSTRTLLDCTSRTQCLTDTFYHNLLERWGTPAWILLQGKTSETEDEAHSYSRAQYATLGWIEYCYYPYVLGCTSSSVFLGRLRVILEVCSLWHVSYFIINEKIVPYVDSNHFNQSPPWGKWRYKSELAEM